MRRVLGKGSDDSMDGADLLTREWHERRSRYHTLEVEAKASASNLCMAARRRRIQREREREGDVSLSGNTLSSLFDHILHGDGDDSEEEGDLEEELQRLYEVASHVVLPLACAVIVLVMALRRGRH